MTGPASPDRHASGRPVIPLVDLAAQYQAIQAQIDAAVLAVLRSGHYVQGDEVAALEAEFARCCGAAHAIAVNSGTSALHLALLACGVGPGAEVITVPFTFVATAAAIRYTGATPVFVDVDPHDLTMDVELLEHAITPRTKAILPVHLYGQPADMTPILAVADRHGLPVIEDAAQAHGASDHGRTVGSLGALGCFSFYPSKTIGACGEGGIVVTNDSGHARRLRALRDWGQQRRYVHDVLGYNYRMDELQAAILRVKLPHLDAWIAARRGHAATYGGLLAGGGVTLPVERPSARHTYYVYTVRSPRRDVLRASLERAGIQTGIHYPVPLHLQPAFADLGRRPGDFPVSESAAREVLSLPMFPELTDAQIACVAAAIQASDDAAIV